MLGYGRFPQDFLRDFTLMLAGNEMYMVIFYYMNYELREKNEAKKKGKRQKRILTLYQPLVCSQGWAAPLPQGSRRRSNCLLLKSAQMVSRSL